LDQPASATQNDLTVTTDRSGPGGIAASSTAQPQSPATFPGEPITAVTTRALNGAATSRTLHQGNAVSAAMSVVYDAAGNVVSTTDPEGRTTSYTYTPDGQPLTKTGPSGTVTTQTYDPVSGLVAAITVTAPGQPTRAITFTRVPAGQPGAAQIETVSDGTDTIKYGYDVDGHRTSVVYPDGTSTTADYNDKGQLASTTDVTGAVTTYVYDATDGTLTSATQRRGSTVLASVTCTYDALSRVATTTRGNGIVTTNTYTPQNQLATETTTGAGGVVLEAHSYTYDAHYNPATRTDTYGPRGSAAPSGGTWTTVYSYDAYDRLISSAVYTGPLTNGQPSGLPVTTNRYAIDLAGDVVSTTKTARLGGVRPITTTTTSTNTIDDSGRLTAQQTGSTPKVQTFDGEGRVLTSLDGSTTTYMTDGSPASTTLPDSTTTSYKLWPDGTRRSATTTSPDAGTSTITYHYGVDGVLANDSTSDSSTPAGTASTASYLLTAGREARTLVGGTALSGRVTGTPSAPIDTGTGVGYYLRDRHTSVTGMVDDSGSVTATYAYGDYGAPARADGRPVNVGIYDGGRTNPFTYLGASPRGPMTDVGSALLAFADRTYDSRQGRFTSPDPADGHNRYQAFKTNPITYVDLSGSTSTLDIVLEAVFAVVMVVTTILTAGAADVAVGAIGAAVEAGTEIGGGVIANLTANIIGTVANVAGAATSGALAANDTMEATGNKGFLSTDQRDTLVEVNSAFSAVAGATGVVAGFTDSAAEVTEAAAKEALGPPAPTNIPKPPPTNPPGAVGEVPDVEADARVEPPAPDPAADAPVVDAGAEQPAAQNAQDVNEQIIEGPNRNAPAQEQVERVDRDPGPAQQPVAAGQNKVLPNAAQADRDVVNVNPVLNVAVQVPKVVDEVVEEPTASTVKAPVEVVKTAVDPVMKDEVVVDMPTDENPAKQVANFPHENVILLKDPAEGDWDFHAFMGSPVSNL
jgi:RHS repeat-associated protein